MTMREFWNSFSAEGMAAAQWIACVICTRFLSKRHGRKVTAAILLAGLPALLLLQTVSGYLPRSLWLPDILFIWVCISALLALCCAVSFRRALYNGIRVFLIADLVFSLEQQISFWMVYDWLGPYVWVRVMCYAVVYGGGFTLIYWLEKQMHRDDGMMQVSRKELISVALIVGTTVLMSNLSFFNGNTPFSSTIVEDILNIRVWINTSGYFILCVYHLLMREFHIRTERNAMEDLLQAQMLQHRMSRESMDVLNRKYHDFKHQIEVLRTEENEDRRNVYLDRMEKELQIYETQHRTGSPTLDVVLASKSYYCIHQGIQLTCVADGGLLGFMDAMDICSVFGNALDNAIECSLKISQPQKRMIHMSVSSQKEFLLICVENYCEQPVKMRGGLPVSTKNDREYHGFGMQSIRYIAQKYGGSLSIRQEHEWFRVLVMLPLHQPASADVVCEEKVTVYR